MTARHAWSQVAHDLRALAESIDAAIEQPVAGSGVPPQRVPAPAERSETSASLGVCPKHRVAWTVRRGGISKSGKPYPPFWRCNEKDADGYCSQRPVKAWADSHPIPTTVDDQVPF